MSACLRPDRPQAVSPPATRTEAARTGAARTAAAQTAGVISSPPSPLTGR